MNILFSSMQKNGNGKKFRLTRRFGMVNGAGVRDTILRQGLQSSEAIAYFWGNMTQTVQDTGKGVLTAHSGQRAGIGIYKGLKDSARGDVLCTGLCAVSALCETASGIIVWVPLPVGKICTISGLKGISYACLKIRDLCALDPSNPVC